MAWWRRVTALFFVVGIVLSSRRAWAATIPVLVASVTAFRPTMAVGRPVPIRQSVEDAVRREAAAPEYVYGVVLIGYDDAPNLLGTRATCGGQGYDGCPERLDGGEPRGDGMIDDGPAAGRRRRGRSARV